MLCCKIPSLAYLASSSVQPQMSHESGDVVVPAEDFQQLLEYGQCDCDSKDLVAIQELGPPMTVDGQTEIHQIDKWSGWVRCAPFGSGGTAMLTIWLFLMFAAAVVLISLAACDIVHVWIPCFVLPMSLLVLIIGVKIAYTPRKIQFREKGCVTFKGGNVALIADYIGQNIRMRKDRSGTYMTIFISYTTYGYVLFEFCGTYRYNERIYTFLMAKFIQGRLQHKKDKISKE